METASFGCQWEHSRALEGWARAATMVNRAVELRA